MGLKEYFHGSYVGKYNQQLTGSVLREPALVSLNSRFLESLVASCAKHCLLFLCQFILMYRPR